VTPKQGHRRVGRNELDLGVRGWRLPLTFALIVSLIPGLGRASSAPENTDDAEGEADSPSTPQSPPDSEAGDPSGRTEPPSVDLGPGETEREESPPAEVDSPTAAPESTPEAPAKAPSKTAPSKRAKRSKRGAPPELLPEGTAP